MTAADARINGLLCSANLVGSHTSQVLMLDVKELVVWTWRRGVEVCQGVQFVLWTWTFFFLSFSGGAGSWSLNVNKLDVWRCASLASERKFNFLFEREEVSGCLNFYTRGTEAGCEDVRKPRVWSWENLLSERDEALDVIRILRGISLAVWAWQDERCDHLLIFQILSFFLI